MEEQRYDSKSSQAKAIEVGEEQIGLNEGLGDGTAPLLKRVGEKRKVLVTGVWDPGDRWHMVL